MYRHTLFNTPGVTGLFNLLAWLILGIGGWKLRGRPPQASKYIVIAYPHTSNWDVPFTLMVCLRYRMKIHWVGKASLFCGPMGPLMKWLGGIPVYPRESRNQVQQIVDAFESHDELVVVISPEGARALVDEWRTGFYHIAVGAGVPIVLGFLDFARREGGYLDTFYPRGDIESDLPLIKAQYRGIRGLYPEQSVY